MSRLDAYGWRWCTIGQIVYFALICVFSVVSATIKRKYIRLVWKWSNICNSHTTTLSLKQYLTLCIVCIGNGGSLSLGVRWKNAKLYFVWITYSRDANRYCLYNNLENLLAVFVRFSFRFRVLHLVCAWILFSFFYWIMEMRCWCI